VVGSYGAATEPRLLDLTLAELGVAPADIVAVLDGEHYRYVRLAADLEQALLGNA